MMEKDKIKCLLLLVIVIVLACGCKDKRQRAIELNNEGWELMGTWMPDSLEMALAFFDKAIDMDSTYSVAYVNKVQCLNSLDRRAEIMSTMEKAYRNADSKKHKMQALFSIAMNYGTMGDSVKADSCLRKVLDMEPEVLKELGGDLYEGMDFIFVRHLLGMDKEAQECFDRVEREYKEKLDTMGWNFYRRILKVDRRTLLRGQQQNVDETFEKSDD